MKVALSTSVIQRGRSGIATYVFGLLDGFRSISADIELCLIGLDEDRALFARWLDHFRWIGLPESLRPALRNVFWHQTGLRALLRREKIDVLHIPSYRRAVWHPPCASVVTVHDLAAFKLAGKYDAARMAYGRHVVPRLLRHADVLTAVSHATAADLESFCHLPRTGTRVIWNGLDHAQFHPPEPALLRQRLATLWPSGDPYLIYIARLEHPAKNHIRLFEAFETVAASQPRLHLVIGGADWHGAEEIHRRLAASHCRERIHHLGFVDRADLPFWYAGATALVFPSLFEGFGFPPLEAMACGCPVVSSTEGSLDEILGPDALRFRATDTRDIAQSIQDLIALPPAERARRVNAGLAHAARFTWESNARDTLQCYLLAQARHDKKALLP
ncbi:MAG: glycosyltransferase family 1 protein [Candidatus Methylacidiphilales bacterium]|nr:glycosyltransferase family 1 protein [Candidatus Methylacidiphilales bacterium]